MVLIRFYCEYKQTLSNNLKPTNCNYHRNKLNKSSNYLKQFWTLTNELAGRVNKKRPISNRKVYYKQSTVK